MKKVFLEQEAAFLNGKQTKPHGKHKTKKKTLEKNLKIQ